MRLAITFYLFILFFASKTWNYFLMWLLYAEYMKLSEIQHGREFLSGSTLLLLLSSIIRYVAQSLVISLSIKLILDTNEKSCLLTFSFVFGFALGSNKPMGSILRSRAMMISGRLLHGNLIIDDISSVSFVQLLQF